MNALPSEQCNGAADAKGAPRTWCSLEAGHTGECRAVDGTHWWGSNEPPPCTPEQIGARSRFVLIEGGLKP